MIVDSSVWIEFLAASESAAAAAIDLQEAIRHEAWALSEPMRIRSALHAARWLSSGQATGT